MFLLIYGSYKLRIGGARWKAECCERRAEILAEASSWFGESATSDWAHPQERETKERAGNILKLSVWLLDHIFALQSLWSYPE